MRSIIRLLTEMLSVMHEINNRTRMMDNDIHYIADYIKRQQASVTLEIRK